jgi:DNA polymerase-1
MNKERLLNIFSRINKDEKPNNLHHNSRVLIVDGMNTFLRSFAVVDRVNMMGNEVGGLIGFLKSLGHAIKLLTPTRVVIVFDGEGGSVNRKYLYNGYKSNRDTGRIMNYKSFNNKQIEDDSKYTQISRLIPYLECLPLTLMSFDKLEADDVIGYLSNKIYEEYDDSSVYIMSTDNDFMQLVNDRTNVYSPTKKKIYGVENVIQDFGVHPNNFIIYKTLVGDTSDNIPGVHGAGEKNVIKLFEFVSKPEIKTLEDVYEVCKNPPKNSVVYERVINFKKQLEIFYKLMDLKNPNIHDDLKDEILNEYHSKTPLLRKFDFIKLYHHDRMGSAISNLETWTNLFSPLNNYQ